MYNTFNELDNEIYYETFNNLIDKLYRYVTLHILFYQEEKKKLLCLSR